MNYFILCIVVNVLHLCVAQEISFVPLKNSSTSEKIVGGKVISISDAPYQVSLQYNGRHECGGSIIAPSFILSAAHCTLFKLTKDLTVRVGTEKIQKDGEVFSVKSVKNHPRFSLFTLNNDFSLLELNMEITLVPGVKEIIEMPAKNDPINEGIETFVSGWGLTQKSNEPRETLRGVILPTVNQKTCKEAYKNVVTLTNNMFCAGDVENGGIDSCQGDSGGPMKRLSDGKLIGVVSFGKDCALPEYPGVYSKVSSARDWIVKTAKIKE